jgi:hypothetical protein
MGRRAKLAVTLALLTAVFLPTPAHAAGGNFRSLTTFPAAGAVRTSGDFNADSDPDLVAINAGSDTASILLGGPGTSFSTPTSYAVGDGPIKVLVGDLNGDADPDLAVLNTFSNNVSILVGGPAPSRGRSTSLLAPRPATWSWATSTAIRIPTSPLPTRIQTTSRS